MTKGSLFCKWRGTTYIMVKLIDDERLDYLLADQTMKIIQSPTAFSFSIDAVLLAHFANIQIQKGKILDLCTVYRVILYLLSQLNKTYINGDTIQSHIIS